MTAHPAPLTDRQLAVLDAMLRRVPMKEAACELGNTHQTVKGHHKANRVRLGVESTEQAIYVGARRGWLRVQTGPGHSPNV